MGAALGIFVALVILFLACGRFYEGRPSRQVRGEANGTYTLLVRGEPPVTGFTTYSAAINHTEEIK